MDDLLVILTRLLPLAAGTLRWPWWLVPICGTIGVFGCLAGSPDTVQRLNERDGLMLATVVEFTWTTTVCAALFGLGRLLRLI